MKILFIGAHPDDIELMAGSIIAKVSHKHNVCCMVVTNGDKWSCIDTLSRENLIEKRIEETKKAFEILGVKKTIFLSLEDGLVFPTSTFQKILQKQISLVKPVIIVTHSLSVHQHIDHYYTSLTLKKLRRNYPNYYSKIEILKELLEGQKQKNIIKFDVSDEIEKKCMAVKQHTSQFGNGQRIEKTLTGGGEKPPIKKRRRYFEVFYTDNPYNKRFRNLCKAVNGNTDS